MGMASFSDNKELVRSEFRSLSQTYQTSQQLENSQLVQPFQVLSMGMSGDYQLAIEEGSNLLRIGSLLFGARG
jgi:uncharacterized pyridoxal phosphate-containing UPF0001 family protein